jgi:1,4-dihydroxy-2-naphthoate octaprenyltransferase
VTGPAHSFSAGLWRLADPKISLASFASLFLGAAAAAADGSLAWGWLALTVAGIFALEVAKNASGEVFDYDSGTDLAVRDEDRSPFSGGKRVLVDGLLSRPETWGIAVAGYLFATAAGLVLVVFRAEGVLWLGVAGIAGAFFYHAPPFRLSYRGWGEVTVAVCYGPLIASGTYLVQRGVVEAPVILASVPLGLLIAAFLIANEFPDLLADQASGKRTLVVRLGRAQGGLLYVGVVAGALLLTMCLPLTGLPLTILLGLMAAVPASRAIRVFARAPVETARIVPAQTMSLLAFVLYAVGSGVGLLLGR